MKPSRATLLLVGFVLGGCSKSEAPTAAPAPAPSAAPSATAAPRPTTPTTPKADAGTAKAECPEGRVPAGIDFACVKLCETSADCKKGEECRPTSWDMGGGMYAHDKACF